MFASTTKRGSGTGAGRSVWPALCALAVVGCYHADVGGDTGSVPLDPSGAPRAPGGAPRDPGPAPGCDEGAGHAGSPPAPSGRGAAGGTTGGAAGTTGAGGGPYRGVPPTTVPASCPTVAVARWKELLLVDPTVLADERADNTADNAVVDRPLSFRRRLEDLAPDPAAAGALADAWLEQWKSLRDVPVSTDPGAARVPVTPRAAVDETLRCAWAQRSVENACDADCRSCRARRLDLTVAPFRLLAVANRLDLAVAPGASPATAACGTGGGELRFVYGAVAPDGRTALPFTVIFEYQVTLRSGEMLRDWAAAWHALGGLELGPTFVARLADVVARGLARATLRRVLTNEVAFGMADGLPWEMRQFVPALTDDGVVRLVEVATAHTPRLTLGPSAELGAWIDANAVAVLAGDNRLDARFLSGAAPLPSADFAWKTAARDPAADAAFNRNSCNGCHGGRAAGDVPFQHLAPPTSGGYGPAMGPVRISRYLNDPGADDELRRRERTLGAVLCGACSPAPTREPLDGKYAAEAL